MDVPVDELQQIMGNREHICTRHIHISWARTLCQNYSQRRQSASSIGQCPPKTLWIGQHAASVCLICSAKRVTLFFSLSTAVSFWNPYRTGPKGKADSRKLTGHYLASMCSVSILLMWSLMSRLATEQQLAFWQRGQDWSFPKYNMPSIL